MEYLLLGFVAGSFSYDGTLKILSKTHFGNERYKIDNIVFLFNPRDNTRKEAKVISYRHNGLFDYVKLDIINTKEEADSLKSYEIQCEKTRDVLKDGEYFYSDLVSLSVYDEEKNLLGEVKQVEEFPAQVTLRIERKKDKDFFVPFVKEFIKEVDIENKRIIIKVIKGML